MPGWMLLIIALAVFFLLVAVQALNHAQKPVRKAFGGILIGLAALLAVNLTGGFTGVTLPVSMLSIGVSAVGGIPGVTMLLLMRLIL
jgi:hypothetical protein